MRSGGATIATKVKIDPNYPQIRVLEADESVLFLTKFRAEGILKDRRHIVQLLFKMFRRAFESIRDEHKLQRKKVEVVLVLRDAIVAFNPAVLELPNASIGLIGHVRDTTLTPPHTKVSFERYPPPFNFDVVIVVDPMVATGGTLSIVLDRLLSEGKPGLLIVSCILLTKKGANRIKEKVDLIYNYSVEKGLVNSAWLKPGVRGVKDLGDLIFKTALDWENTLIVGGV